MNIHEYQAKELLKKYGVAVPDGIPAMSVAEAVEAAKKLPGPLYVVKAQIHAGGRRIWIEARLEWPEREGIGQDDVALIVHDAELDGLPEA